METLNAKLRKLFGEDVEYLSNEKLTARLSERIEDLPKEKVQILSRALDPEIKNLDSKIQEESDRCKIYASAIALGSAAVVGFGVYELVPAFEPLKEAVSGLFGFVLENTQQEAVRRFPDLMGGYKGKSNGAEDLARIVQGVFAAFPTFAVAHPIAYASLLAKRVGDLDIKRLEVYRKIKEATDCALKRRYADDLDSL